MKPTERTRLTDLFAIQNRTGHTRKIRAYVKEQLEAAGCTVRTIDRQLYARKGSSPDPIPFIVAHADSVHTTVDKARYQIGTYVDDSGDIIHYAYDPTTRAQRGIGGDDKVGLWIAIEAARRLTDVGIIITVDEEIGAVGALKVPPAELMDAAVLIQADRRGGVDAITEGWSCDISSKAWQAHVEEIIRLHGFAWSNGGTITDVSEMVAEGISGVSAVNLAAGYYHAHTDKEIVAESEAENALACAIALAEASAGTRWTHVPDMAWGKADDDGFGYRHPGVYTTYRKTKAYKQNRLATGWDRSDSYDGDETNEKVGDLWFLGSKVFRRDAQGAWREDKDYDTGTDNGALVIIQCEAKDCVEPAENWMREVGASLCYSHEEEAITMLDTGCDLEMVRDVLLADFASVGG
jgi:hypothetical protein